MAESTSAAEAGILKLVWMVLEPLVQHSQQPRDEHHGEGIEVGQPRHDDGREAHAAGGAVVERIVCAGDHQDMPTRPAMAPDRNMVRMMILAHVHARVAGGPLALAHDGDLIAVLAVLHVE